MLLMAFSKVSMGIVRIRFVQNWIKDNILALLEFMILINIFDIIIDFILIFDFLHNNVSKIDTFDYTVYKYYDH